MGAINYKRIGGNEEGKIKFQAIFSDEEVVEDAYLVKQFSRTGFRLGSVARPSVIEDFYLVSEAVNVGDAVLPLIVDVTEATYTPATVTGTWPVAAPAVGDGNYDVGLDLEGNAPTIRFVVADEEITGATINGTGWVTTAPATVSLEVEGVSVTIGLTYTTNAGDPVEESVCKIASFRVGTFNGDGNQYILGGEPTENIGIIPVLD